MSFDSLNATEKTPEQLQAELAALQAQLGAAQAEAPADVKEAEVVAEEPQAEKPKRKPRAKKKTEEPASKEVAAPTSGLAALFGAESNLFSSDALEEFEDSSGGSSYLFPELVHDSKSNSFTRARHMNDGDGMNLPEGSRGFVGVLMGYRFRVTAWPEGYGGDKKQPVYSVAIGPSDREHVAAMKDATRKYQYTRSDDKGKWDYDTSGVGHTRCQLEMLCYDPHDDSLFVLQGASHYTGTEKTRSEILKHLKVNEGTGKRSFVPFVAEFTPEVDRTQKTKGGHALEVPYVGMEVNLGRNRSELEGAWESFQEFVQSNATDESLAETVQMWITGGDNPVTDKASAAWAAAADVS